MLQNLGWKKAKLAQTYLVDLSKGTVTKLANNFPNVIGVNVPANVLILLELLFDFNRRQAKNFAEPR